MWWFTNSISNHLSSFYHLYTDDLQIYTQAMIKSLPEAFNTINADLRHIGECSHNYELKVKSA